LPARSEVYHDSDGEDTLKDLNGLKQAIKNAKQHWKYKGCRLRHCELEFATYLMKSLSLSWAFKLTFENIYIYTLHNAMSFLAIVWHLIRPQ
jgi:hypothetical protein